MAEALAGLNALITGGSRGLGLHIARAYEQAGASVLVVSRNAAAGGLAADVSDPAACAKVAERGPFDVLVNNAAVLGPIGPADGVDWEEWVQTIQVNLLGTVAMTRAVLPGMRERGRGKIINLSGGGATGPRPNFSAYAASKAAVVRFTETLAHELQGTGIEVNAIAPGALNTRMRDAVVEAGPAAGAEYEQTLTRGETSFEPATKLAVFLASSDSDGITGRLIAALWDDWEHFADLDDDAYTLRRIVP